MKKDGGRYEKIMITNLVALQIFLSPIFLGLLLVGIPGAGPLYCSAMDRAVLAEVNGEAIVEKSLCERIKAIHKNKPQARPEGGAGGIKISDLVKDMIDERLMVQEAYRLELDNDPDFQKKVESYIATQSVLRLRQEVVLDKISISDDELLDYFKKEYEKEGAAPEGKFDKVKRRLAKRLKKEKEKELADKFVASLRDQADIRIDNELFDSLDPEIDYSVKKSVIARVNGQPIYLDDMLHDMRRALQKRSRIYAMTKDDAGLEKMRKELKQGTLDNLIAYELVEQEALRRNYVKDAEFMDKVQKRKDWFLVNEFKAKIVYPLAVPTEKELTQYYEEHIYDFKEGYEVRFSEIIFSARKDAEKALEELRAGAGFEYLAARLSERWMPRRGRVWVNVYQFSPAVRQEMNRLKVGEISDVIADGRQYKIIKLKGKRGGEPIEFSTLVEKLKKVVVKAKFGVLLSDYLEKLRKGSRIKINEKAIKRLNEKYL